MLRRGERGYVGANLGQDHFRRATINTWDNVQLLNDTFVWRSELANLGIEGRQPLVQLGEVIEAPGAT